MMRTRRIASIALLGSVAAACTGTIGEPADPGEAPAGQEVSAGMSPSQPKPAATAGSLAGTRPLRRLTRLEYDNTVRDLLGDTTGPASAFPADLPGGSGFATPTNVSRLEVDRFADAAAALATSALGRLTKILPCDPAAIGEGPCAARFIETFGARVYRRPLSPAEKSDLQALHTRLRGELGFDFKTSVGYLLRAMLQSPRFLYHWGEGDQAPIVEGGFVRLGPYEVASRLSYFLWSTMPDEALFAAAAANALGTPAQIEAQARRMLADARAGDTVRAFFAQLLEYGEVASVSKDPRAFPSFDAALATAMAAESDAFVKSVVLEGDGRLETLLTAPHSFVNGALATLYGLRGITGSELRRVSLDPTQRAGILTHASFLTTHARPAGTSPVQRGKVIRLQLLCQNVPPPPPEADTSPPKVAVNASTRAQYEAHATVASCKGCHAMMDPLGFGLENFDGIGAYRTMEGTVPVDASGAISNIDGGDTPFAGPIEMARALVRTAEVQRCLATQLQRWVSGRADEDGDRTSVDGALLAFRSSGLSLRELMIAVAKSPGFTRRLPLATETLR